MRGGYRHQWKGKCVMNKISPEFKMELLDRLDQVIIDAEVDAHAINGKPFTGETVATHIGYLCAQVKLLAKTLKVVITVMETTGDERT